MELTQDEHDLILQLREWKDGIPDEVIDQNRESGVYVSLVSARAELYRMAIRHGHNDVFARRDRMLKLIGPGLLIELCKAWEELRLREREDELREEGAEL